MAKDLIRISLKAYDHKLLDKSAEKIIRTAKSSGAIISGPIPMPTKRTVYTVLRSPFVNKKSREQFQTKVHKRVVDIVNSTPKTVESLMKLDLPSGGKKIKMSQIFNADGHVVPVTLVQAGPCVVSQVKTKDSDGYNSVQLAFGEKSKRNTNKPGK